MVMTERVQEEGRRIEEGVLPRVFPKSTSDVAVDGGGGQIEMQ